MLVKLRLFLKSVTIATNMAGRGTDIKLSDSIRELGGLCVVGTERHESRRIDNQLRGRSGRQGDPGYTQFFVSMKDDLMVRFGSDRIGELMKNMGLGDQASQSKTFSVSNEVLKPPSLQNIFKELEDDLHIPFPKHNSLKPWAKEGVLLLNAVLTVEEHTPTSHKNRGWETFTDEVIKILNNKTTPVVFILWGSYARAKKSYITNPIHYVIESPHPSPFSAYNGFFGSKPFSKTNKFLKEHGLKEINWKIE